MPRRGELIDCGAQRGRHVSQEQLRITLELLVVRSKRETADC
jgi:hypothetical protein